MAAAAMTMRAAAVRDANKSDGCDCVREGEVEWVEEVAKDARQAHDCGC